MPDRTPEQRRAIALMRSLAQDVEARMESPEPATIDEVLTVTRRVWNALKECRDAGLTLEDLEGAIDG